MTVTTDTSSCETLKDTRRFFDAARHGRLVEVIELSSKFNDDVNLLNIALLKSCGKGGHLDVVQWLVEHTAAEVYYNKGKTWTPLTMACFYDHLDIVKYLIEAYHADVNLPDRVGNTPLISSFYRVNMSVSKYLLNEVSDLDVNIVIGNGNTALHLVILLCKNRNTQLHKACDNRDATEVLRLVCVKGHKINVQDNAGYTPLHLARYKGNYNVVETLMLAGADETITNESRETPAQLAKSKGHRKLLELLDRDNLLQVMVWRRKKLTLSLVLLIMLPFKPLKHAGTVDKKNVSYNC